MSDKFDFTEPQEDWNIDELIADAKQQLDDGAENPFHAPEPLEEPESFTAPEPFDNAQTRQLPVVPTAEEGTPVNAEPPVFEPEFGDAFEGYGDYVPPVSDEPYPGESDLSFEESDEELYDDSEPDEEDDVPPPEKPKRKRKRRFVPLPVKILLYLVIVGVAAVGLGYGIWECACDVLAFGRSDDRVTLLVTDEDSFADIVDRLEENGVIKYPWLFEAYCDFTDSGGEMVSLKNEEYESFDFYTVYYNYDYHALTKSISPENYDRTAFLAEFPAEDGNGTRKVHVSFSNEMLTNADEKSEKTMSNQMFALYLMVRNDICTTDELFALMEWGGVLTAEERDTLLTEVDEDDIRLLFTQLEKRGLCSAEEIFSLMERETNDTTVRLTIPEGMNSGEIFALMEKNGVCTAEELAQCAASTEFDYWFLEGIPYGEATRLEGFLFPDTYDFYRGDDPERVLKKLLTNFNRKFSDTAMKQLDRLNEKLAERLAAKGFSEEEIEERKMTIYDLIIVASMIERETAGVSESINISSVIYNRLCDPANFPCLQIDATVVYALGGVTGPLTYEDTRVDSPYNTYLYSGLPIGPISCPGLSSISAALNPADTDYYYYALDPETGSHHFSATLAEHNAFLEGLSNEE